MAARSMPLNWRKLLDFLPVCIQKSFFYSSLNAKELQNYIELAEDQEFIRQTLPAKNLCAFIADGSILPRESGISSRPMKASIPFTSPDSLRISINLPIKENHRHGDSRGNHSDRRRWISWQIHASECTWTWCIQSYPRRWTWIRDHRCNCCQTAFRRWPFYQGWIFPCL